MIFPLYAVVGLLVGQVVSQAALSPCAAGCVDGVLANTSKGGCAVGDTACVCRQASDVTNGVRDCIAASCAAEGAEQLTLGENSAKDRCAAAVAAASPSAAPAAPATTTTPAAETPTPAPTTSPTEAAASPTSTPAETTTQPASTSTVESTTTAAESTSAAAVATSTTATTLETSVVSSSAASTSATASPTTDATSSTSQSSGGAAQTGEANGDKGEIIGPSGLSIAAKAGIGAGVGVALIMTGLVAICLTVRRKQKENEARRGNMIDISGPLPGGGRQWADGEPKYGTSATAGARKSYSSELDRHARPYEEMVPHTQPRNMI